MFKYLNSKIEQWSKIGIKFPFAHDPTTDKPSVTLLFPYVSFALLVISSIALHFEPKLIIASIFMALIWVASTVFYLMRKLHKASINFKEGSVDLKSGGE